MAHISTTTPRLMGKAAKVKTKRKLTQFKFPTSNHYLSLSEEHACAYRAIAAESYTVQNGFDARKKELPYYFWKSYMNLLGHILLPGRELEDWQIIRNSLINISWGAKEKQSLKTWPYSPPVNVLKTPDPRHACWATLQRLPELMVNSTHPGYRYGWRQFVINSFRVNKDEYTDISGIHLAAMSSLATGHVLHRSGKLFLIDTSAGRDPDPEDIDRETGYRDQLVIAKLRPDGIFAVGTLAATCTLTVSEIKDMREFVGKYAGRPLSGCLRFFTKNASMRLAKAIGLKVDGKWAHLQ